MNRKKVSAILSLVLIISNYTSSVLAATTAALKTLPATSIMVDNQFGTSNDTIVVMGVHSDDVVSVYGAANGGTPLVTGAAKIGKNYFESNITGLNSKGGTVYVSVTNNGTEGARTAVKYVSEPVSTALSPSAVTVNNNSGTSNDNVVVNGLVSGDTVNIYSAATGGVSLASGTVESGKNFVSVPTNQLAAKGGTIYVSITNANKLESTRTAVKYDTEVTKALTATAVKVDNKYGTSDIVTVTGLVFGDVVNIYSAASGGTLLASGTVGSGENFASVPINKLVATGGTIYVSLTNKNKAESSRVAVKYVTEPVSIAPVVSTITVNNNSGTSNDNVVVNGLVSGDIVNIYSAATGGVSLASGTVGSGKNFVSVPINQLAAKGGTVYVSVKNSNKLESTRTAVKYDTEVTKALTATAVKVDNKYGTSDIVTVTGLVFGDVVNIYSAASGGTLLASGTVGSGENFASVPINKLVATGGTIYVSLTNKNKAESSRVAVKYVTEPVSIAPVVSTITVNNNSGTSNDNVVVNGLVSGDIVNIYSSASDEFVIASAKAQGSYASLKIDELVTKGGTIYVSVTNVNKLESPRTAVKYDTEISKALSAKAVKVKNKYGAENDTVEVAVKSTGLVDGDVINIYSSASGGNVIASKTVTSDDVNIYSATPVSISTTGLLASGGTIYVSLTSKNKVESTRVAVKYSAEPKN